ncbi:MAG: carboxymuconolactone decarboxylase family protein [Eggerthellaceae bacterium]|jgi:4-carboxymuconolactone decarboxylase|nr:carboxymuconolactone decarboxylase family protein [Eggerthellaceae bacterium]MCH4221200.1 carboxymuconolactone decarboxylase family protein [Eggerthellaceae bacterium]
MTRIEQMEQTKQTLGLQDDALAQSFPEFAAVKDRFMYGEAWHEGVLDETTRFLVSIACLATVDRDSLPAMVHAALVRNVSPVAIQEVFHQIAPYIGLPKAERGLAILNSVYKDEGIRLPLKAQATVNEDNRLARGIEVQKSIFGPAIDTMRASAPSDRMFVQDALSAYCFGDTYTRNGLDLKTRELLTFVSIISLGGCDKQATAHAAGNISVGNTIDVLVSAVKQCISYIGFPRSLNALAAIDAAAPNED